MLNAYSLESLFRNHSDFMQGITVLRKKTITLEAQDDCTGRTMRYGPALLRSARPGQR